MIDKLPDRAAEENGILWNNGQALSQGSQGNSADVDVINHNRTWSIKWMKWCLQNEGTCDFRGLDELKTRRNGLNTLY